MQNTCTNSLQHLSFMPNIDQVKQEQKKKNLRQKKTNGLYLTRFFFQYNVDHLYYWSTINILLHAQYRPCKTGINKIKNKNSKQKNRPMVYT